MNNFTRSAMLVALLLIGGVSKMSAQSAGGGHFFVDPRLIINSPASIVDVKAFSYSSDPATHTTTAPWGRLIDSVWLNVPVVKAYDTLGVNPLLNGTGGYPSMAGKFALILRGGGISFSQKAAYCKNAGAIGVIIVNHKNGGLVNMAGTAPFDAQVAGIPVLFLSKDDGTPMNEALKANQAVTVSIGKWGFNLTNDVGIAPYSPANPHAFCIPITQVNAAAGATSRAYDFYTGAYVANFGTSAQTNVKMKQTMSFTPTGGSASVIYADSVTHASFPVVDSIHEMFSPRFTRQNFGSTGVLTQTYTVSSAASVDGNPTDNTVSYQTYITDSIFCKSHWNPITNAPVVTSALHYPSSTSMPTLWGPMFYVAKGGYQPKMAQLAIAADSDVLLNNGVSPSVLVYLFKWTDANNDGRVNGTELSIVASGFRSSAAFTMSDSSYKPFTVNLTNPKSSKLIARLQDNSWYFLAAEIESDFFLGADHSDNYFARNKLSVHGDSSATSFPEFWAPLGSTNVAAPAYNVLIDTLAGLGFDAAPLARSVEDTNWAFTVYTGLVPSMALHISKTVPTGVENTQAPIFNTFNISPNPANSVLTADVNLIQQSNMVISVINSVGQSFKYETKQSFKSGRIDINTANYPSGTYYLLMGTDAGSEVKTFTVVH